MQIIGLNLEEVEALVLELGEPRYRARQLLDWVYKKGIDDFGQMTNLPALFRHRLQARGLTGGALTWLARRKRLMELKNIYFVYQMTSVWKLFISRRKNERRSVFPPRSVVQWAALFAPPAGRVFSAT